MFDIHFLSNGFHLLQPLDLIITFFSNKRRLMYLGLSDLDSTTLEKQSRFYHASIGKGISN